MTARFYALDPVKNYDIIDGETGNWKTQGMQGANAMTRDDWNDGDEAWPQGTTEFDGQPIDVAS